MASRYRKKFALPEDFMEILEAYSKEVLRDQPIDIVEFSYLYFKALEEVSVSAPVCRSVLTDASHNCRELSKSSTIPGRARTFHLIKPIDHPRQKTRRVRKSRTRLRVTTTKMEIRSTEATKTARASMARRARTDSTVTRKTMETSRTKMASNRKNMATKDRNTGKRAKNTATNND